MQYPKYRNKKILVDNIKFDSVLESNVYLKIKELAREHEFKCTIQPFYLLQEKYKLKNLTVRNITYTADFELQIGGNTYTLDVKGMETDVFKIKKKMFGKVYGREVICIKSVKQFVEWFRGITREV